ncbi:MAG: hypothetical protein QXS20_03480 [Candidatus Thorarchaeota archaeon]
MKTFPLSYFCSVCGNEISESVDIESAPAITQRQIECPKCGDKTHLLLTYCPKCNESIRYFVSDLDFNAELLCVADSYVRLIRGIRDSLSGQLAEFVVPLPKRWSIKLRCDCGNEYSVGIPLPQMD